MITHLRHMALLAVLGLLLPGIFGCPAIIRGNPRGQVLHREEPVSGQGYELYIPSSYYPDRDWPVVVTCHGTKPLDSADLQIREWMELAEQRGLIVIAPELMGTHARGDSKPKMVEDQIHKQRYDELTIIGAVNHVRAGYRVDEGRIFLTGWSAGNYAVLWTGLSHPETFRALAVRQGNFDARFVEPLTSRIDRNQSVLVFYGQVDFLRPQAEACIRWLKEQGMSVFGDEIIGSHRRAPDLAYKYFLGIAKAYPWLVIQWDPGWAGNPLTARFRAKTDPPVQEILWDFGDGQTATGSVVDHKYAAGGTYKVTVRATFGKDRRLERTTTVTIAPAMVREGSFAPSQVRHRLPSRRNEPACPSQAKQPAGSCHGTQCIRCHALPLYACATNPSGAFVTVLLDWTYDPETRSKTWMARSQARR